ncbi:ribosome maturation factor RimM [Georgenia sp. TF02-10]|uniref:ribosome maturation factor RimM n=1 Tax=Georgenia sp. TF02-10 TaxID=2917725 RepID=UPI001FA7B16A|nr:ribosome maturation factor RimM [Georgenia sp. TF02-10]UNX55893.1 ribosome maturation factor RimM [Georgenia sp. TF02-10]
MLLTVAVVGAPHGLKGEVRLDLRTDDPARRLAVGNVLETDPADAGPLTLTRTRQAQGVTYAVFAEARDRTAAESLRGVRLVVESDEDDDAGEEGWYAHELRGLAVTHVDGRDLGVVTDLETLPGHDVLVVAEPDGATARVPFVAALVPAVDVDAGVVTVDPPRGLFAADPAEEDEDDDGAAADETAAGSAADGAEARPPAEDETSTVGPAAVGGQDETADGDPTGTR